MLDNKFSDKQIQNQVDFMLRKSGTGYSRVEVMLNALAHDRRELYKTLVEIADDGGNISLSEIQDQVEYYKFINPHVLLDDRIDKDE